jgi:CheY-like chemotaxis protein
MSKLILIVDDDPEVRELLKIALTSQRDFAISEAEDGLSGFEIMRESRPDLVLLDIQLPRLNGYDFLVRAQKDETVKHIPLFVITSLTADSKKTDAQWRQSLGVAAFQSKPFQPLDILKTIDSILEAKERERAPRVPAPSVPVAPGPAETPPAAPPLEATPEAAAPAPAESPAESAPGEEKKPEANAGTQGGLTSSG